HRRSATPAWVGPRSARAARIERRTAAGGSRPAVSATAPAVSAPAVSAASPKAGTPPERTATTPPEQAAAAAAERTAAIFWPDAAGDLVGYVLFPKGNDRFLAHGYYSIVATAFAAADADDRRAQGNPPGAHPV